MRRLRSFAGRSVVITGGASGIGLALAGQLVDLGATVTLADLDAEGVQQHAERLNREDRTESVFGRSLDVRDLAAFRALVGEVVDRDGSVDYLFNNAGISMGGPTEEFTDAHWERIIDVNVRGVVNGVLAAYPGMVERGRGHIVNTASGLGLVGAPFVTAYSATKHAVVGLSTALRAEASLHGVKVSVVCPGSVDTPILDRPPDGDLPAMPTASATAREYGAVLGFDPCDADHFARRVLRAIGRNRGIIVEPMNVRAFWYLSRVSPRLVDAVSRSIARKVDRELVQARR